MKVRIIKTIAHFMALGIFSVFNAGCEQSTKRIIVNNICSPSLKDVDSIQKSNAVGAKIENEDSLFTTLATYNVVGFGHYHDKISNYNVFRNLLPKLRKSGFLVLAIEIPSSLQPLLDSIMDAATPREKTTELLHKLNKNLKEGDGNLSVELSPEIKHPLFSVILDWLSLGGVVIGIDVPYLYDNHLNKNIYHTDLMLRTIKEQSPNLYDEIKVLDLNRLNDNDDLIKISTIRSAYMAAMLDYYARKGSKIVGFLGVKHLLLNDGTKGQLGVSVVPTSWRYFKTRIFTCYPYFTNINSGFYKGHEWVGNICYTVQL